ncbi:MAG: GAF domain-containing protein [Bacteroidetes bacterium]|nr:GAF domain-containing protein [Bacteroidota bacterium]
MAETLFIKSTDKKEKYSELFTQLEALLQNESDIIANTATIAAAIKQTFDFLWVGFYFVKNNELVLGPFQGQIACTRIAYGRGVCGSAWKEQKTIIVPDVDKFPGHIACSSLSRSEIVVPIKNNNSNTITMVLDIDSETLNSFNEDDKLGLEKIIMLLA